MGLADSDLARQRLKQVFKYLAAFNELQNPVERHIDNQLWSLRMSSLPGHSSIGITWPTLDEEDDQSLAFPSETAFSAFELRVRRPTLSPCPAPPDSLVARLADASWRDPDGSVNLLDKRTELGPDGSEVEVGFESDPVRTAELDNWISRRTAWAVREMPARAAMKVYEELYRLQARLDREFEEVELVLGDGILVWEETVGTVQHPLLLQKVHLTFDPSIPEFTISEAETGPELYTALLNQLFPQQAVFIQRCIEELEEKAWHPVGGEETAAFLARLASQLGPSAEFTGDSIPQPERNAPRIGRDAVIFLRKRTLGFNRAIADILRDLEEDAPLPKSITSIVGVDLEQDRISLDSEDNAGTLPSNGVDEEILLGKEANAEQLEIARRLRQYGAVLVQGPPGTGKTHTIANLIGHLLSEGKRVLVTSQTAKALKVLRDKVVKPLQPLCVSLSQGDSKQLESAIDEISERLASSDARSLAAEASALEQRRLGILRELRRTREKLLEAQRSEYTPIVVAGKSYSPSEAARYVAETRDTSSWLPGPLEPGSPLPLSEEEVRELYSTNEVTPEQEREIALGLPEVEDVLPPSDFERLCLEQAGLVAADTGHRADLWGRSAVDVPPNLLDELLSRAMRAVDTLQIDDTWFLTAVEDGRGEGRTSWEELISAIDETVAQSRVAHSERLKHDLVLPADQDPGVVLQVLEEVRAHLARGGSLGPLTLVTRPVWCRVLNASRVDGHRVTCLQDVDALLSQARLNQMRARLLVQWGRLMSPFGAPSTEQLGGEPEIVARRYAESLRRAVDWFARTWQPLQHSLQSNGFDWEAFLAETPIEAVECADILRIRTAVRTRLPSIIDSQVRRLTLASLDERLASLSEALERAGGSLHAAGATASLLTAVRNRNVADYRSAYERLIALKAARKRLEARYSLLSRLEPVAPTWAYEIRNREGLHGETTPPGEAGKAWIWRQLEDELEARAKVSLTALQDQATALSHELRETTASLIEKRAWAAQLSGTSLEQRQALNGWKQLVVKAGKRKGKRAPRLLAEARRLMPICQTAVPVWIMPLNLVVDSFSPKRNRFDVVVIDEASQANILALTALYLGDQVVVVGDHEQVSPEAVGQRIDEVQGLIDLLLRGIPNRELYDGQTSIYHLAQTSFGGAVMLREHFRCVPAIIQFSNLLSYQGKIRPLRDDSDVKVKPPTIAYRVYGNPSNLADSRGKTNPLEAKTVAALLLSATQQPEYTGKTFGVISMVGTDQAMLIDSLLQRYMDPGEYIRRQVLCGNPAQFQGDERDVVFLSMVDAPRGDGPLPLRPDPGDRFKKRFNVAASRPRDQLWVVHSIDPDIDLKPEDLRRRLILHARGPYAAGTQLAVQEVRTESEFERQVLTGLFAAGYRVIPQWPVGAYRIDLVVEGGGRRVAIECDGDRFHTPDNLAADMGRQLILERLGWRFLRIRGSHFFRDPEGTLTGVIKRLKELGITADGFSGSSDAPETTDPLQDRVVRRATEFLADWGDDASGLWVTSSERSGNRDSEAIAEPLPTQRTWVTAQTPRPPADRPTGFPAPSHRPEQLSEVRHSKQPAFELNVAIAVPPVDSTDRALTPHPATSHKPRPEPKSDDGTQQQRLPFGDPLMDAIRREGLEAVDRRSKGGALWIVGGTEIADKIKRLAEEGYTFTYAPNGGRATKHRPSWWTSGVSKKRR